MERRDGTTSSPTRPWRVFVSHAHTDVRFLHGLEQHLAPLVRQNQVELFHDRKIGFGSEWRSEIDQSLDSADIVILLVSADFVASYYCFEVELQRALEGHRAGFKKVLPVHVRPVSIDGLAFSELQGFPSDQRSVSQYRNKDAAWREVVEALREALTDLQQLDSRASEHQDGRGRPPTSAPTRASRTPASPSRKQGSAARPVVVDVQGTSRSLEERLIRYYGPQHCVVDGNMEFEDDLDWVALDRDNANVSFANLIPLGRRHRLRPAGHRSWSWGSATRYRFNIDLTAENLLHQSRKHFYDGRPSLSFGCARLGEVLSMREPEDFEAEEDDGWAFLSQCMFYLPYRMEVELLETTLSRIRHWLDARPFCPEKRRSGLLLAIANIYQDLGEWSSADELYDSVLRDDLLAMPLAATIRRRLLGSFFRSTEQRAVDRQFALIDELRTPTDFRLSVAIAKGWWAISQDEPGQTLRNLEPFDFDIESIEAASDYSPHNALELKLTQAAARAQLGLSMTKETEIIREIVSVMADTRLRPVFTDRIASAVLGPELNRLIHPLRSPFIATPALVRHLRATATRLQNAPVADIAGRPTWVD